MRHYRVSKYIEYSIFNMMFGDQRRDMRSLIGGSLEEIQNHLINQRAIVQKQTLP